MSKGKILLVGFGPGSKDHMSYRAREAIAESDVVIGYSTYIKLVKDQLDGKEVIKKGMTEEIDRCIEAHDQAKLGKTVSLISSGDIGVYGMAGPTYEVLLKAGWTPESDIKVEIIPGATALSACASLVGAPLTHDFCSISLSDLLTPWTTIAGRIEAAASSDFVVALYNPKSGRRTQQIVEAQRIMLQYRDPKTPVAIVKSAYRELQEIQMVTLDKMSDCKIGMLTTVLIGNSSTYMQEGLMITPRGYANKYQDITGEVKDGEKRGRSLSMGLIGWKECVREYLTEADNPTINKVATHFNSSPKQIIDAISEATPESTAGDFKATIADASKLNEILEATKNWGALRGVIRNNGGGISELMVNAKDFDIRGDWLNIENDYFHMHVNWSNIVGASFVQNADRMAGVHFFDKYEQTVFNLSLIRKEGEFDADALTNYQQSCERFAHISTLELEA